MVTKTIAAISDKEEEQEIVEQMGQIVSDSFAVKGLARGLDNTSRNRIGKVLTKMFLEINNAISERRFGVSIEMPAADLEKLLRKDWDSYKTSSEKEGPALLKLSTIEQKSRDVVARIIKLDSKMSEGAYDGIQEGLNFLLGNSIAVAGF
jgi:hypothetical protein